jgi:hypothetical protein
MKTKTKTKKGLNMTNSYRLLPLILCLLLTGYSRAQVTIGANEDPNKGALLDLKENTGSVSATKGLLLPRVNLTDLNELYPMFTGTYNAEEKNKHIGLTVYNVEDGMGRWIPAGIYVWDGTK